MSGYSKEKQLHKQLLDAAKTGDKAEVLDLLSEGANIEDKDDFGRTPLEMASRFGHVDVVEALLSEGANIEAKGKYGYTPLHLASAEGHADVVEALLAKRANIEAKDIFGRTPLHDASSNGHAHVVEALLAKGANIEAKDNDGYTPLHCAIEYGHADVVKLLTWEISPFFSKLTQLSEMETIEMKTNTDQDSVYLRLKELSPLVGDVHQMKLLYTAVALCRRLGALKEVDSKEIIYNGLETTAETCLHTYAIAIFKLIIAKAKVDGFITGLESNVLDNRAELKGIEHAPFIKSMMEAIHTNTQRIEGLEANVKAINDSVNRIKDGLQRKMKLEIAFGLVIAVVNAMSFGVGGSVIDVVQKMAMDSIIDFGDPTHIMDTVIEISGQDSEQCVKHLNKGKDIAAKALVAAVAGNKLNAALRDRNILVVVSAVSHMVDEAKNEVYAEDLGQNFESLQIQPHKEVEKWLPYILICFICISISKWFRFD